MATIKFENGVEVEFEGSPTQADIEEVAKKLNIGASKPKQFDGFAQIDSQQQKKPSFFERGARNILNVATAGLSDLLVPGQKSEIGQIQTGVAKGIGSTAVGAAELGQKIGQQTAGRVIEGITGTPKEQIGGTLTGKAVDFTEAKKALEPTTGFEKIGKTAEQIGEFFVPGGAIAKGEKAIAGAGKLARIAGGAALEGTGAGVVSAVQTGGDLKEAAKNALIAGALSVPFKAFDVLKGGAAEALKSSAEKKASQALGATTKYNKELSDKVVPELLNRKVRFLTRGGLEQRAISEVDNLGEQIGLAFDNLPADTKSVVSPIIKRLEDAKSQFVVKGTSNIPESAQPSYKALQNIQKEILDLAQRGESSPMAKTVNQAISYIDELKDVNKAIPDIPQTELIQRAKDEIIAQLSYKKADKVADAVSNIDISKISNLDDFSKIVDDTTKQFTDPTVSIESLRSFRQILDNQIKKTGKTFGLTGDETVKLAAQKEAANAIRNVIANDFPDIAKLNKEFSFWSNVQKVVGDTVQRTKAQGGSGVTIAEGAGAVTGAVTKGTIGSALLYATIAPLLVKAVKSPAWRMTSAVTRNQIANLIAKGSFDAASKMLNKIVAGSASLGTRQKKQETQ